MGERYRGAVDVTIASAAYRCAMSSWPVGPVSGTAGPGVPLVPAVQSRHRDDRGVARAVSHHHRAVPHP
jgi:hypothetical protein